MCQRIGRAPISIIGFGLRLVSSAMRLPEPPGGITGLPGRPGFAPPLAIAVPTLIASLSFSGAAENQVDLCDDSCGQQRLQADARTVVAVLAAGPVARHAGRGALQ